MTDPQTTSPEEPPRVPGWYPDLNVENQEQFWDGTWTGRTRAADPEVELHNQDVQLLIWGVVTAMLVPIIGFILGAITCARARRVGSGVGLMLVAIVMSGVWFAIYLEVAKKEAADSVEQILQEDPSIGELEEDLYDEDLGY